MQMARKGQLEIIINHIVKQIYNNSGDNYIVWEGYPFLNYGDWPKISFIRISTLKY
jgi:hypothetical protein